MILRPIGVARFLRGLSVPSAGSRDPFEPQNAENRSVADCRKPNGKPCDSGETLSEKQHNSTCAAQRRSEGEETGPAWHPRPVSCCLVGFLCSRESCRLGSPSIPCPSPAVPKLVRSELAYLGHVVSDGYELGVGRAPRRLTNGTQGKRPGDRRNKGIGAATAMLLARRGRTWPIRPSS